MKIARIPNFLCSVSILVLAACSKESKPVQAYSTGTVNQLWGAEMVLGKKLNNPYSLPNMQAAYESLAHTKSGDGIPIDQL